MANSGGEDEDWGEGSGDEEEREEGDDDLMEVLVVTSDLTSA
jgi:hypothetical protein